MKEVFCFINQDEDNKSISITFPGVPNFIVEIEPPLAPKLKEIAQAINYFINHSPIVREVFEKQADGMQKILVPTEKSINTPPEKLYIWRDADGNIVGGAYIDFQDESNQLFSRETMHAIIMFLLMIASAGNTNATIVIRNGQVDSIINEQPEE